MTKTVYFKKDVIEEIKGFASSHKKLTYDGVMNLLDKKEMFVDEHQVRRYVREMVEDGFFEKTGTKPIFFSKKEV